MSADGLGNVYVTGRTWGDFGGTNAGQSDCYLAKYDSSGSPQWTRQWGTSDQDLPHAVSVDGLGNLYVTGYGPFMGLGGNDVFLRKYDSAGSLLWTQLLGTSTNEGGQGVTVDNAGNVYITGNTDGLLGDTSFGGTDAYVAKYDSSGSPQWIRQLGTSGTDVGRGVVVDGSGNVFVTGHTDGSLGGTNAGGDDAFLAKYDNAGSLLWAEQLGTPGRDYGLGVSVDGSGRVYVTGETGGLLGGSYYGDQDAFVAQFVPEPTTLSLLALGGLAVMRRTRR